LGSPLQPVDGSPDDGCRIDGARKPSLARWTSAQRRALEIAMKTGIAVVAADDCRGLRLLPGCRVRGHYGYLGAAIHSTNIELSTDEEVRVNAPLADATTPAGALPLGVETTIAGERATTRAAVGPEEPSGDCAGATHFVSVVEIGAISVGHSNDAGSTAESCQSTRPGDVEPVPTCSTLVGVTVEPITKPEERIGFDRAPAGKALRIGMCPPGMVVVRGSCVRQPVSGPYLCQFGDAAGCGEQCDRGDVNSCDVLGFMYWHGKGVPQDMGQATKNYTTTCDKGDTIGCSNMAVLLHRGEGTPRDLPRSAAFFERACVLGDKQACANLGESYLNGEGVVADRPRGASLVQKACDAGLAMACENIAKRLLGADPEKIDPARGLSMLEELCDGNNGTSCTTLGRVFILGEHFAADHPRAAAYLQRACQANDDDGCVLLGLMYRQADGVTRDDALATQLMDRACADGDPNGCLNLGIAYEHGKGVAKDEARAAKLYEEACSGKVATGCMYFADSLRSGTGVATNAVRAREFYGQACALGEKQACIR
jgi:TPR repeat protein